MTTARVFKSGNSQAVRLPKAFRFNSDEVEIFRRGDEVVMRAPRADAGSRLREAFRDVPPMPNDFLADGRRDLLPEDRESI